VPWQTFALAKLHRITGKASYREAAFVLNDRLASLQEGRGARYPDWAGQFRHPRWGYASNSASTAVYAESLASASELARDAGDRGRESAYAAAARLAAWNLANLQFRGENMYYVAHPEKVRGGIRTSVYENRLRIDNTQHAIDALRVILAVLGDQDLGRDASKRRSSETSGESGAPGEVSRRSTMVAPTEKTER
jgi:hypothetical protein